MVRFTCCTPFLNPSYWGHIITAIHWEVMGNRIQGVWKANQINTPLPNWVNLGSKWVLVTISETIQTSEFC